MNLFSPESWRSLTLYSRSAESLPESILRPIVGPVWGYRWRARLAVRHVARKGAVLVRLDTSAEEAQLSVALADASFAHVNLERARRLRQNDSVTSDNPMARGMNLAGFSETAAPQAPNAASRSFSSSRVPTQIQAVQSTLNRSRSAVRSVYDQNRTMAAEYQGCRTQR